MAAEEARPPLVIVLQGGIGNQLFQYAAGLAVARSLGAQLWLTPAQENKHSGRDYRKDLYNRAKAIGIDGQPAATASTPFTYHEPQDAHGAWEPVDYATTPSPLLLKGYFQYLPPIQHLLPAICSDILAAIGEHIIQAQRILQIRPEATAFVHVRRGDFLQLPETEFWRQDAEYYEPALAAVRAANPSVQRILLFSDDPAWCSCQPFFKGVEVVECPDELHTLAAMSLCEGGAVIANSTFSWWGAMLGPHKAGKPVVYPARWYKDVRPVLFPAGWTQV